MDTELQVLLQSTTEKYSMFWAMTMQGCTINYFQFFSADSCACGSYVCLDVVTVFDTDKKAWAPPEKGIICICMNYGKDKSQQKHLPKLS